MKTKYPLFIMLFLLTALLFKNAPAISAPPIPGATRANKINLELTGQIGGAMSAVFARGDTLYVAEGARLTILNVSNPESPAILGKSAIYNDVVKDIYVRGDYAYIAAGNAGLRILNISSPAQPTEVGVADVYAYAVTVAGNYAYIISDDGVRAIDISNPAAPVARGEYSPSGGPLRDLAAVENYIYVVSGVGVDVVDASDPASLKRVTSLSTGDGCPWGAAVVDNRVWIAAISFGSSSDGLFAYDISNPAAPIFIQNYPIRTRQIAIFGNTLCALNTDSLTVMDISTPEMATRLGVYSHDYGESAVAVAIVGNLAYIAAGASGLQTVDISQTARESGYYYPPGSVRKATSAGQYAYITLGEEREFERLQSMRVVDLSTPETPAERGAFQLPAGYYTTDIAAAGDYVYLLDSDQGGADYLRIVNVANPAAPQEVSVVGDGLWGSDGPVALAAAGNYVYAANHNTFRVIDVSNPLSPTVAATYPAGGGRDVTVVGRYAYVPDSYDYSRELKIIDIFTPTAPLKITEYTPEYAPHSFELIAIDGAYAYLVGNSYDNGAVTIVDVSNPFSPTQAGSYLAKETIQDLEVAGDALYLTLGDEGLSVVDVSAPAKPVELLTAPYWTTNDITIVGDYAYVAAGWKGFRAIDISGVSPPARSGAYISVGKPQNLALAGNYVYAAAGEGGLKAINVSNPAAPTLVDAYRATHAVEDVALSGNYAYAAVSNGLRVLDISNPAEITETGFCNISGSAAKVAISTTLAYVGDQFGRLRIVDISNPAAPSRISEYFPNPSAAFSIEDVAAAGNFVYLAGQGLEIVDVSHPFTPVQTGIYTDVHHSDAVISGSIAYLAAQNDGLQIMDVSNPAAPVALSAYAAYGESAQIATLSGDSVYIIADNDRKLRIVDFFNPAAPVEVGVYVDREVYAATISGNYAWLAVDGGVIALDISAAPKEIAYCNLAETAYDLALTGNYLYATLSNGGLRVIDISNPAAPAEVKSLSLSGRFPQILISGNYAYVASSPDYPENGYLSVLNIANPAAPVEAGVYNYSPSNVSSSPYMALTGNYLYLAYGTKGMDVLDISYPPAPNKVDHLYGRFINLGVSGNYLYVTNAPNLNIYSLADPGSPVRTAYYAMQSPFDIAVAGNYIYVLDEKKGVVALNVANPVNPTEIGVYDSPGRAMGVAIAGRYAYLVDDDGNLQMINVSDPAVPVGVAAYRLPTAATDVVAAGDLVYVADGEGGLLVLRSGASLPVVYTEYVYLPLVLKK